MDMVSAALRAVGAQEVLVPAGYGTPSGNMDAVHLHLITPVQGLSSKG